MRSLLSVSLVSLMALGACSQSLTNDRSGAGGTGGLTGMGGEGANTVPSTGGTGGQSMCDGLAAAYQTAVKVASSCAVGGTGQCQQLVNSTLSVCGSCQTYVSDASRVNAIQQAWDAANCAKTSPPVPCALILCATPTNNACAANPVDPTSMTGTCSVSAVATGGTSGGAGGTGGSSPDGGLSTCGELVAEYASVLAASKSCQVGAANQCAQQVPTWLSVCSSGCTEYVNDATALTQIRQKWSQAGCANGVAGCPAIACLQPSGSVCVATDGGTSGVCSATTTTEPVGLQ